MGDWSRWSLPAPKFDELVRTTFERLDVTAGAEEIIFECTDKSRYRLVYHHDCCASCSIEDICGDLNELSGTPILRAEQVMTGDPDETTIAERKARYDKAKAEFKPRPGWEEFDYYEIGRASCRERVWRS